MDKRKKITIIIVVFVLAFIVGLIVAKPLHHGEHNGGQVTNNNQETKLGTIASEEDLSKIVDKVYEGLDENLLPKLETVPIIVSDENAVKMLTGLDNGNDLEFAVISQPLMNAQAYSLVLAKVKDNVNANDIAKKMSEQVDVRRWICVEAEKVYATNSGNIVCLVMTDAETAKKVYDSFKNLAGSTEQEYERTAEEIDLPPDMY